VGCKKSSGTASPPAPSLAIQCERFIAFQHCFDEQRPHQALRMQTPASFYHPSALPFPESLDEIRYDEHHVVRPVRNNGAIRWRSKEVFITEVLRRERVGLLPTSADAFQVYFGGLHLGLLDGKTATFTANRGCFLIPEPVELTFKEPEREVVSG